MRQCLYVLEECVTTNLPGHHTAPVASIIALCYTIIAQLIIAQLIIAQLIQVLAYVPRTCVAFTFFNSRIFEHDL